jgi:hypothetical protein
MDIERIDFWEKESPKPLNLSRLDFFKKCSKEEIIRRLLNEDKDLLEIYLRTMMFTKNSKISNQ